MVKFSFKKNQLNNAFQVIASAVDRRQLLPVIASVLVRRQENKLLLTATDLEIEFTAAIESIQNPPEQSFTLPAKKFIDVLKTLRDDDELTLSLNEKALQVKCASSQFKFPYLSPATFPLIQTPSWKQVLELKREDLLSLLEATSFAVSQQDIRVFLNGLLFECDEHGITTVGADGHRMAIARHPFPLKTERQRYIFPRKGVMELARLLNIVSDEMVTLSLNEHFFRLETSMYQLTSKLIDAQYLPYAQAIPKQLETFVIADVSALKSALSRIMIIANDRTRPVIFHIEPEQLSFTAQNQEQEEGMESMAVTVDGPSLKVGMNPQYLLEALQVVDVEQVKLSFYAADTSVLMEPLKEEGFQYIIMPMKI